MKKTLIIMSSLMVLASGTVTTSSAEDIAGRSGLGIGIGYITPKGGEIDDADTDIDTGFLPSINYTYGVSSNFSLEVSLARAVLDVEIEDIDFGELTTYPLQVTAQYRIPAGNILPYFGAGVGYYFNEFDEDSIISSAGVSVDTDNSFGFHVNAGCDFFLNQNSAINLDARYFWSKTSTSVDFLGTEIADDDLDLDSLVIGAGLKYFF